MSKTTIELIKEKHVKDGNWINPHDPQPVLDSIEELLTTQKEELVKEIDDEWKLAIEKVDVYGEFTDKDQEEALKLVIQHTKEALLSEFERRRKNKNLLASLTHPQD